MRTGEETDMTKLIVVFRTLRTRLKTQTRQWAYTYLYTVVTFLEYTGDQKVSVQLMITIQKVGAQKFLITLYKRVMIICATFRTKYRYFIMF